MTESEREREMEAKLVMFREGDYLVFSRWSALKLAIKYDSAEDGTTSGKAVKDRDLVKNDFYFLLTEWFTQSIYNKNR